MIDTKLARETKRGIVLQLCLYADLLGPLQGGARPHSNVVAPWSGYEPRMYRVDDYASYFRRAKSSLVAAMEQGGGDLS